MHDPTICATSTYFSATHTCKFTSLLEEEEEEMITYSHTCIKTVMEELEDCPMTITAIAHHPNPLLELRTCLVAV
jgi:ribosomal 50S subunit-associated protein YjgA (DUF615 family)